MYHIWQLEHRSVTNTPLGRSRGGASRAEILHVLKTGRSLISHAVHKMLQPQLQVLT